MRFVVVQIEDNDEADAFISAIRQRNILFARPIPTEEREYSWQPPTSEWEVPQVYAVPTLFCECPLRHPEGRSKKFGWYVCTKCSKPRRGSMQHPYNLVDHDKPASEWRYYMGFRSDRQGWRYKREAK